MLWPKVSQTSSTRYLIYQYMTFAAVYQRTISLASGGLIAPPAGNLTIDSVRLSVVISLVNGFMVSVLSSIFV